MHSELQYCLDFYRQTKRHFNVSGYVKTEHFNVFGYIETKCRLMNEYFRDNGINSVVVGISGGIDSAVVLALLAEASSYIDSPIKKIASALLPVKGIGTTGQNEALMRGREVIGSVSKRYPGLIDVWECDLSEGLNITAKAVEDSHGLTRQPWAYGQISSIIRTPALYYIAALLQDMGDNSALVSGTTNRSEGAYIGFFGKASDAMVDIQPISDIHKSEVYKVARYLDIPEIVVNEVPKGDVWNGQCDEQMFGSTYDFLELYHFFLNDTATNKTDFYYALSADAMEEFVKNSNAIEAIHRKNSHKYRVGSPAVHFDVMERKVTGGWQ